MTVGPPSVLSNRDCSPCRAPSEDGEQDEARVEEADWVRDDQSVLIHTHGLLEEARRCVRAP